MLASLRYGGYRWLWISNAAGNSGRWAFSMAIGWLTLELTHSGFWVGALVFASSGPLILVSPLAGMLADRIDRRLLLAAAFGVTALACGGIALLSGLHLLLRRTQIGRELRATAADPDTAELVGVNARAVYARATAIAVAVAALAGVFYAMRASFDPFAGPTQLIYAFEAVVIGGIGSLWGTLVGGIVLGVAQTVSAQINVQYFQLGGHLVFLAVLVVRAVSQAFELRLPRWVGA